MNDLLNFSEWLLKTHGERWPSVLYSMAIPVSLHHFVTRQTEYMDYVAATIRHKGG